MLSQPHPIPDRLSSHIEQTLPSCYFLSLKPPYFLNQYSDQKNTCPQCRESFASRRNCKPDPSFDQLLAAIFGTNTATVDDAFLEPNSEALEAAKAVGSELEVLKEAQRAAAIKAAAQARAALASGSADGVVHVHSDGVVHVHSGPSRSDDDDSGKTYKRHSSIFEESGTVSEGNRRKKSRPNSAAGAAKAGGGGAAGSRPGSVGPGRASNGADAGGRRGVDGADVPGLSSSNYYGVREYTGRWVAYAESPKSAGVGVYGPGHTVLGQFNTEVEAAYIYDVHTLRNKGAKASQSVLNFPHLVPVYTRLLANGLAPGATAAEYEAAVQKVTTAVRGLAFPANYKPPSQRHVNQNGGGNASARGPGRPPMSRSPSAVAPLGGKGENGGGGGAGAGKKRKGMASQKATREEEQVYDDYFPAEEEEEEEDRDALRAKGLFTEFPSEGMVGPGCVRPSLAMVEIRPASDVPDDHCWHMGWMRCPANATIEWIAEAVAAGHAAAQEWEQEQREQQEAEGKKEETGTGTGTGTAGQVTRLTGGNVLLHAVNELDASADFAAVYAADGGEDGALALRRHLTVRDLLLVLADCGEDLVLEYTLTGI